MACNPQLTSPATQLRPQSEAKLGGRDAACWPPHAGSVLKASRGAIGACRTFRERFSRLEEEEDADAVEASRVSAGGCDELEREEWVSRPTKAPRDESSSTSRVSTTLTASTGARTVEPATIAAAGTWSFLRSVGGVM